MSVHDVCCANNTQLDSNALPVDQSLPKRVDPMSWNNQGPAAGLRACPGTALANQYDGAGA